MPTIDGDPSAFAHMQPDQANRPDAAKMTPAAVADWTAKHPEASSEIITFRFRAKNRIGALQRYAASCTFQDQFDGTAKLTDHAYGEADVMPVS